MSGFHKLNGIEVARQIRRLIPTTKIVFLTQEATCLLEQVLRLRAEGYVVKAYAARELLRAAEAVGGRLFVSNALARQEFRVGDMQDTFHNNVNSDFSSATESSEGMFPVDMDFPMPVDLAD